MPNLHTPQDYEWIKETMARYEPYGFFATFDNKDPQHISYLLEQGLYEYTFMFMSAETEFEYQLGLLTVDNTRVYVVGDLEVVYDNGNVDLIRGLAQISRDAFVLTDLHQEIVQHGKFDDDDYRKEEVIQFKFNGHAYSYTQDITYTDYLNYDSIIFINKLMQESAYRFEMHLSDREGHWYLVSLTANEKRQLMSERGWRFYEYGGGHVL